jgi:hypothetical protein
MERVNNTFQQLLRCFFCYGDGSMWTYIMPQVEFMYNASRALRIEHTPLEASFGFSPKEPMIGCLACDLQLRFHKTHMSG